MAERHEPARPRPRRAQAIAAVLARQTSTSHLVKSDHALDHTNQILAGLGSPTPVEIRTDNPLAGKSLAEIRLRGLTGATVLAIQRGNESIAIPAGNERLQAGDILALAGTHAAVSAAQKLLAVEEKA